MNKGLKGRPGDGYLENQSDGALKVRERFEIEDHKENILNPFTPYGLLLAA